MNTYCDTDTKAWAESVYSLRPVYIQFENVPDECKNCGDWHELVVLSIDEYGYIKVSQPYSHHLAHYPAIEYRAGKGVSDLESTAKELLERFGKLPGIGYKWDERKCAHFYVSF
jgi:hypothetical protein